MAFTITPSAIAAAESANAIIKVNGAIVTEQTTVNFMDIVRLEANAGYAFTVAPYFEGGYDPISGTSEKFTLTLSSADTIAESSYFDEVSGSPTLVVYTASTIVGWTIPQTVINTVNNNAATMYIDDVEAVANQVVESGSEIKVVADDGFKFEWVDEQAGKSSVELEYYDPILGITTRLQFPLDATETIASAIYGGEFDDVSPNVVINITTVVAPVDESDPAINNVYIVDADIVEQVNLQRFVPLAEGGVDDYGVYILSLLQLPFEVDPALVAGSNAIKLGNRSLTTVAPQMTVDKVALNLGEITIPEVEGNSLDYTNVQTILHLPYMGSIVVDHRQVIGETLGIEYIVDVYNGSATVNLTSTKVDGEVFHSVNFELGIDIPFISEGQGQQLHNNLNRPIGDNHIRTPFIELVKNDAVLPYGFFTIPIVDEGVLLNETGYVVVENIDLKVSAISNEKEAIIRALSSGVIIK